MPHYSPIPAGVAASRCDYWTLRSRAPTAMKTTPMIPMTTSGVASTELHSIPAAAPTAMAMPTANMIELRGMKPVSNRDCVGSSAVGHTSHPRITAPMRAWASRAECRIWVADFLQCPLTLRRLADIVEGGPS